MVGPDGESGKEPVNFRVPMALIRAGGKLAALIPTEATKRVAEGLPQKVIGIDVDNLTVQDLEQQWPMLWRTCRWMCKTGSTRCVFSSNKRRFGPTLPTKM